MGAGLEGFLDPDEAGLADGLEFAGGHEGLLEVLLEGLVGQHDQIDPAGEVILAPLDDLGDADVVGAEDAADGREDAGSVEDGQAEVVAQEGFRHGHDGIAF